MFAKVNTAGLLGIDGFLAEVECDIQNGLPGFFLTGALSPETREAQFRVWNALKNSDFPMTPKKVTVNFSPAFIRKDGTSYDLPIAIAVLSSMGIINYSGLNNTAFFGEVGLDGSLKRVRGALSLAFVLKRSGVTRIVVPKDNIKEAALAPGMEVIGCRSISDVVEVIKDGFSMEKIKECGALRLVGDMEDEAEKFYENENHVDFLNHTDSASDDYKQQGSRIIKEKYDVDFCNVHGQDYLKRAAEIAVSGRHNILMSGPAGTGKTMIARRMPTIMPDLTRDEDIEISMVYSVCGLLPADRPLLSRRPFRSPHHGISDAAFAGGGSQIMPGEMSLASGGILFLDEMPLFSRVALETMRQPMEDRKITITRVKGSYTYPADFMLVGAMNNCACGFYPDKRKCTCTRAQIKAYMGRLSKPLLERIDICAAARPVNFDELTVGGTDGNSIKENEETSDVIKKRVVKVYKIQAERFKNYTDVKYNSRMGVREIEKFCALGPGEKNYMREIYRAKSLSGRTYHKILKVARTIADMEGSEYIRINHLQEAVGLRSIEDELFKRRKMEAFIL